MPGPKVSSHIRFGLIAALALVLCSCANAGFKVGGSANGFEDAQRTCKAQSQSSYQRCMQGSGWYTSTTGVATGKATSSDSAAMVPATRTEAEVASLATPKTTEAAPAPSKPAARAAPQIAASAMTSKTSETVSANTEDIIPAASWWKIGGGASELKAALAGCGSAPGIRIVSSETASCMQAKGWFPAGR